MSKSIFSAGVVYFLKQRDESEECEKRLDEA